MACVYLVESDHRGGRTMRIFAVIVVLLAVALPAHAQINKLHRNGDTTNQVDQKKAIADEKAYQDAVKRIPDPKEKYDPWGNDEDTGRRQETIKIVLAKKNSCEWKFKNFLRGVFAPGQASPFGPPGWVKSGPAQDH